MNQLLVGHMLAVVFFIDASLDIINYNIFDLRDFVRSKLFCYYPLVCCIYVSITILLDTKTDTGLPSTMLRTEIKAKL